MRFITTRNILSVVVYFLLVCWAAQGIAAQPESKNKSTKNTERKGAGKKSDDFTKKHAQISAIEKYCKEVESYKKEKGVVRKTFATIDSGKKGVRKVWLEFKNDKEREKADTGENLNENAFIWIRKNKIVAATFTFQDTSRKWVQFGFYYFRADGSLAKLDEELDREKIKFVRKSYFSEERKMIASAGNYYDNNSKLISAPKNFADRKIPVYKSVAELPFYQQLNLEPLVRKK